MKTVYFDTNVYTHIRYRYYDITTADVVRLISKIEGFKLRVYVSSVVLDETTSAILSDKKQALDRLELILRIAKRNQVLIRYQDIIDKVVKAYVTGSQVQNFLEPPPFRLKEVLKKPSAHTKTALREIATESQETIEKRKQSNQELYEKIWPLAKEEKTEGKQQTFDDYWNEHSLLVAEKFADLAGVLEECKAKGLEGLLKTTVIKTIAVAMLSQGYSNTYLKSSIPRGDFNDLQHAVFGAALGTLVTHDNKFADHLKRLPIDGFEVIDIHTLLSRL
jgi:hypothetical protein